MKTIPVAKHLSEGFTHYLIIVAAGPWIVVRGNNDDGSNVV